MASSYALSSHEGYAGRDTEDPRKRFAIKEMPPLSTGGLLPCPGKLVTRTTGLRPFDGELTAEPWFSGTALAGNPEPSSRRLRTGPAVVRGQRMKAGESCLRLVGLKSQI